MNSISDHISTVRSLLQTVPDFPKPGILFYDISSVLREASGFLACIEGMDQMISNFNFNKIAAIDARGFILGAALAQKHQRGLVLLRKKGKLPGPVISSTYGLEYGNDSLELSSTALVKGDTVILIDDVLATGGTARAACELIKNLGASVSLAAFLIELPELEGQKKLDGINVKSLLKF